jgi:hypothetical protein
MRRNGRAESSQQGSTGSSFLTGLLSLAGGIGIGAGLLYLLDPEQGSKRRRRILSGAQSLGERVSTPAMGLLSSAREYAGDVVDSVRGTASSARDYADDATSGVRGFISSKLAGGRAALERQVCGETHTEHTIGVAACALGSMALGAALMYVLDPSMGRRRREIAMQKAGEYTGRAGEALRSGYDSARSSVSNLASRAGDAVSNAASQAREKVGSMTSGLTGGSTTSTSGVSGSTAPVCPPGMVPNPNLSSGTATTF